jgi:hypothetical protein
MIDERDVDEVKGRVCAFFMLVWFLYVVVVMCLVR